MERSQVAFGGIMPRLSSRMLPATLGQNAVNARLLSGDLEPWRQFSETYDIVGHSPPIKTIYLLNIYWLNFTEQADVTSGPVPGDTTERTYITCPALYSTPVWTTRVMAGGAQPYPNLVRPLGVPRPLLAPSQQYVPQSGIDRTTLTDYVFTLVNDVGEESAPSDPGTSSTLYNNPPVYSPSGFGDYNAVGLVFDFESSFDDYKIRHARIYRAATGATGTIFRFVDEVDTADFVYNPGAGHWQYAYVDAKGDTSLGEPLPSTNWDLPLDAMEGIITLPNGVMAGFKGNILCLSAQNHPHAWPVDYQLTTDTNIVGIENVDTSIVVLTNTYPYIAIGNDPAQYSMTKFEFAQAVTSKVSIALVRGIGVVAATSLGLIAFQGVGQLVNLTEKYFTYEQWQELDPTSIIGVVHNNIYFFFYKTHDAQGGYALDMNPTGFGLVPLSFHATAAYNDPKTDTLHLVLDSVDEPDDPNLVLASTAPTVDGGSIWQFDSPDGDGDLVYRYKGRFNMLERNAGFHFAQVRAHDFSNLVLKLYADGSTLYHETLTDEAPISLNMDDDYTTFEWEFIGTSRVRSVQAVEDISELVAIPQGGLQPGT